MAVEIYPVRSKRDLKEFIMLPWKLYRDDPFWVPPLISDEKKRFSPEHNPFYKHSDVQLFIARKGGETVGRLTAHIDHNYNEFHDELTGQFGFFESINDGEVSKALFDAASEWLRERGMEGLLGPLSFSTNDVAGLLIDDFKSPPVVMMPYNPPYYIDLIESYGFKKAKDLLAYQIKIDDDFLRDIDRIRSRFLRLSERAKREGFTVRPVNFKKLDEEVPKLLDIYNNAWEKNWGFVPMTDEEFWHLARELKPIALPELTPIVEYKGEPVAFGLVLPDVNQVLKKLNGRLFPFGIFKLLFGLRKIDGLRLIALGIKKGYRKRGTDSLLYSTMLENALKMKRFKTCEVSWLLEDNYLIIRATEFMKGKLYKTYRLYYKSL